MGEVYTAQDGELLHEPARRDVLCCQAEPPDPSECRQFSERRVGAWRIGISEATAVVNVLMVVRHSLPIAVVYDESGWFIGSEHV